MTLRRAVLDSLGLVDNKDTLSEAMFLALDTLEAGIGGTQNVFSKVIVSGEDDVNADIPGDALTIQAGTNITLTTDDTTNTIVINSTGGSSFHLHVQNSAATTWTINHNLGYKPVIALMDATGKVFITEINNPTNNQSVVTMINARDGIARCV